MTVPRSFKDIPEDPPTRGAYKAFPVSFYIISILAYFNFSKNR